MTPAERAKQPPAKVAFSRCSFAMALFPPIGPVKRLKISPSPTVARTGMAVISDILKFIFKYLLMRIKIITLSRKIKRGIDHEKGLDISFI